MIMQHILDQIRDKADAGELFMTKANTRSITYESGKIKDYNTKSNRGYAIRLVKNGKLGFSYGNDLSKIGNVLENALLACKFSGEKAYPLAETAAVPEIPAAIFNKQVAELSPEAMIEVNEKLCAGLRNYDPQLLPDSEVSKSISEIELHTTGGFSSSYKSAAWGAGVGATIVQPEDIYQWGSSTSSLTDDLDVEALLQRAIKDIELGRNVVPSISGRLPVVFSPHFVSQLYEILEEGIKGSEIFLKNSPLADKLDTPIFDDRITILEDPLACGLQGFNPFDHEGTIVCKKPIVDSGILKRFYLTRKFAAKLNMDPSGNGFRQKPRSSSISADVQPMVTRNTITINPGDLSLDDMLADIKEGVYCEYSPNLTFGNVITGDFSGSLGMCYKIENGKRIGRMKDLTISGNLYDLLTNQVVALSRETMAHDFAPTFESPHFYMRDVTITG